MAKRRCWNFDQDTGEPLPPHYGCPNPSCAFTHPDSPRWKDATKSQLRRGRSPPPSFSPHDAGLAPMKKVDRGWPSRSKDRPSSLDRRSDGGAKDTSSAWSSSGSTWGQPSGGWGEPASGGGWGEPSSSTVTWGQSSQLPKKPPPPSPSASPHKESFRHDHTLSPLPPPPTLGSSGKSSLNVSTRQVSETSSHRAHSPVEARGDQVDREHSSKKGKEPAVARSTTLKPLDTHKLYSKRISLLSEAVMIRNEYAQVARALEARRKMQSTQKYHHVSENVQSKLDSFAQEYEEKGQELKAKLDDVISRLVEAELWPSGVPTKEVPVTEEATLKQVNEIQDRLGRLEKMIKETKVDVGRNQVVPLEEGEVQPSIGMKRRRESTSDGQTEGLSTRAVLSRVEQLEARTAEIDNQTTQQANNVNEIIDARIEEKLEQLHIGRSIHEDVEMGEISATNTHSQSDGDDIRARVTKLTNDLEGFAGETADLITKHTDIEVELKGLRAENAVLKSQITEHETSQRALKADIDRNHRQIEAVLRAVDIIQESRPAHPAPLDVQAFEPMRKQILEAVLTDLEPALSALREHCDTVVTSAREDTLKQVGAKLGRTVELVNIIYGYLGRSWQGKENAPP